jgi:Cdc6-like AAA superfamily ATPase
VSQRGCHAILYGERGVGKTSLSNMISAFLANRLFFVISRTNCDISDSYSSLWAKALNDIEASKRQPQLGFPIQQAAPLTAPTHDALTPDSVRRALQDLSTMASLIVIFDEFDRIENTEASARSRTPSRLCPTT